MENINLFKNNKKLGVALVGVSGVAERHANAYLKINNANLVGIFGSDFDRAKNFSKNYGIKVYSNFEELLADSEVDIVDIVNIHSQHADFGIRAAQAGKHVIVEKPLDISIDKAKKLINECRKNKVYLTTIFQKRFGQAEKTLKKMIDKDNLGQIISASARLVCNREQRYYDANKGWRGKKELAGGGVLINQAIHIIDTLIYLIGEVSSVHGEIDTVAHNIEVEDIGVGIIHFKNNALATIQATTAARTHLPDIIEIHGTKGTAIIEGETLTLYSQNQGKIAKLKNKFSSFFLNRLPIVFIVKKKLKGGFHEQNLSSIIKAIKNNEEAPVSFEEGLKSLEVVLAIYESSKTKRIIKIKPSAKRIFFGDYYKKYLEEAKNANPKVLLINPLNVTKNNVKFSHIGKNRLRQPLGLGYISSFLKKITTVQLIDAAILEWGVEKTIDYINQVNPEILIVSTTPLDRWQNPDLDINNIFKIVNQTKAGKVIFVGAHGTVTPDWIFENCRADFVVRGEPELICFELVDMLLKNKNDFFSINGLSYREGNRVVHNPERIFASNLDDYPFPDYEALPMHLYRYTTNDLLPPFSLMLTSRGCPGQCTFCLKKMMPGKYRARSAENVYKEIKYLVERFGIKSIYFQDWEFLINKERVKKLCQLLINSPDFKIFWGGSARATSLDDEIVALMKKAGCVLINFGYESGSLEILQSSRKGVSVEKMREAVRICRQYNINVRSFCLVNLPGENKKTLKDSAEFIVKNNLNVPHINIPIPYPGTELAKLINCTSWQEALKYSGKINTTLEPEISRKLLKNYIWQGRFGKLYLFNPKFWFHLLNIIKKILFN